MSRHYQQHQFYEGQRGIFQHLSENIWLPSHSLQMPLETQTLVQVENYTHTHMHIHTKTYITVEEDKQRSGYTTSRKIYNHRMHN